MSEIQTYTPSNGAMLVCSSGGDYIKTKDHLATITRLEAEKAQKQLVIDDCKRNLQEQDAAIVSLREEAALYQKEWAILREEVERLKKELRILYASNADMFARAEQAEAELAAERGKVEERLYPCADCGKLRTKDEGGTTFTVCDECWDKRMK